MPHFDDLARRARERAFAGQDYEAIWAQLSAHDLPPAEQKELRSLVNDFIVQYELAEQIRGKHRTQMLLGGVVILVGLFIIFYAAARQDWGFTIGVALILTGLYVIKKGYDQYRQPIDFQNVVPEKDSKFRRY